MARQTVMTILGLALATVCAAMPALAQTETTTAHGTQQSQDQKQSAAALAREATNPFSSGWLMQIQQNNNWTQLPLDRGRRMQSNLAFQPLVSLKLT
jgi:ABC-type phosphate transport system substrate-binding protein